jgi:integrase
VEVNLETNPAGELDMVALPQPPVTHNPYLLMGEMPPFLGKLHRYGGDINTKLGIRLLLLTGVRTIELRSATPEQFKLDVGLWIIPCTTVKQLQVRQRKERKEIPLSRVNPALHRAVEPSSDRDRQLLARCHSTGSAIPAFPSQ